LDTSNVAPKILILSTWGDSFHQLEVATAIFQGLYFLSMNIIKDTSNVEWKTLRIPMSSRQCQYYSQIRAREDTSNIPYPMSQMVTLYAYPDNIMKDTLSHRMICETDVTTYSDVWSKRNDNSSTWITPEALTTIEEHGPKLAAILDGIISNWPLKQVVMTRFNHRYGVDLVVSFLKLLEANGKNPYNEYNIYHVSCTNDYDDNLKTI